MNHPFNNRKYVFITAIIVVGFIFLLKIFYLQVIDDSYQASANRNALRYITQYPARGLIYDRKNKLLVYNEATYDLMVVPNQVKEIDTNELCILLDITKEDFKKKLEKATIYSRFKASIFEKQISKEGYGFIQEKLYRFKGFYTQTRTLRKYPQPIASHLLGYIGEVNDATAIKDNYYKSGDYIGISGIEKSYEPQLRGVKGMKIMLVDVHNREMGKFENGKYDTIAIMGQNLYTSIDAELQAYGELLMKNKRGSIVAIEPSTGEIIALVSSPSYNPNLLVGRARGKNYSELYTNPLNPLFNRALMAKYPPGSTFKLVTALVGLQEGVINSNTSFSCERGFHFGKLTVACHAHSSPLDLIGSICHSCNAYYCKAFRLIIDNPRYHNTRLGFEEWRRLVLSFGFGGKFNSDLPYELKGNIPSAQYYDRYHGKNKWKSLSIISLAIGQGEIGTTPLQLANLAAIIANEGYYYIPHILRSMGFYNYKPEKFNEKKLTGVDKNHFLLVKEAMRQVVISGTASNGAIDSISVCGKTGTAQNPHGKDHSIFIAFAPKDKPQIAMCVVVENAGFGATYAVPIASLMIEKYLKGKVKRTDLEERIINTSILSEK